MISDSAMFYVLRYPCQSMSACNTTEKRLDPIRNALQGVNNSLIYTLLSHREMHKSDAGRNN